MRYRRAVEKLRLLAEECEKVGFYPPWDEPFLVSFYAFGDVLEGADPLEAVQVVGLIRLPPAEVPWGSEPHGTEWFADRLRLSKGGYEYWWRSYLDPPWNHYIRSPVMIWSQDGPSTGALDALAERRFSDLQRLTPTPANERRQVHSEQTPRFAACATSTTRTGMTSGAVTTGAMAAIPNMSYGTRSTAT